MNLPANRHLWPEALLWLALLGPAFFVLYGMANHYAASLPASAVGNIALDWERYTPLWPWTILPYWSIDLLYGLSLFPLYPPQRIAPPRTTAAKRYRAVLPAVCAVSATLYF
jgi:hypothetical protein